MAPCFDAEDSSLFGLDDPSNPPAELPRRDLSMSWLLFRVVVAKPVSECCPPCFYGESHPRAEVPENAVGVWKGPTPADAMSATTVYETPTNTLTSDESDEDQVAIQQEVKQLDHKLLSGRRAWADMSDDEDEEIASTDVDIDSRKAFSLSLHDIVEPPKAASTTLKTFQGASAHAKSGALFGTGSRNVLVVTQWAGNSSGLQGSELLGDKFKVCVDDDMSTETTVWTLKRMIKNRFPGASREGLDVRLVFLESTGQAGRPFKRCLPQHRLEDGLTLGMLQKEFDVHNPQEVTVILKVEVVHSDEVDDPNAGEHFLITGFGCYVPRPWKNGIDCGFGNAKRGPCDLCHRAGCEDETPKETSKYFKPKETKKGKKARRNVEKAQETLQLL